MRLFLALLMLLVVTGDATARRHYRPRVVVSKPIERPIAQHPYAVEFVLAAILCQFARYSVPPGQQAGQCPPRPEPRSYRL